MKLFLTAAALCIITSLAGQAPETAWERTFGQAYMADERASIATSDGGYLLAGFVQEYDEDRPGSPGWLIKLDEEGNKVWEKKKFYGDLYDIFILSDIQQTRDGGYIMTAYQYNSQTDALISIVQKLSPQADVEWKVTYTGNNGLAAVVDTTFDGGYIISGAQPIVSRSSFWARKLDASGSTEWYRTFTTSLPIPNFDIRMIHIYQTRDSGYIFSNTSPQLVKLDKYGEVAWKKTLPGTWVNDVRETRSDGFIATGTMTDVGQATDVNFLARFADDGSLLWQKRFGDGYGSSTFAINLTSDGGFITAGQKRISPPVTAAMNTQCWVVKFTGSGTIEWEKMLGGPSLDNAMYVLQTPDQGYFIGGNSAHHIAPDGSYISAPYNFWAAKLKGNTSSTLTITSTQPPDKHGCETGQLSFAFRAGEPWTSLEAILLRTTAVGAQETVTTVHLSYPQDAYVFASLKAGNYQVLVKVNATSYYSAFRALEDPAPSPDAKLTVLSTTSPAHYGCAEGKIEFSFNSPDCWKPAEVTLEGQQADPAAGDIPSMTITSTADKYRLDAVPAGKYKLRLKDQSGHFYFSDELEIKEPELICKDLSLTAVVDESQYRELCHSIVTLTLHTAGTCPLAWTADVGAGASPATIEDETTDKGPVSVKPDKTIELKAFRIPEEKRPNWYAYNIKVTFENDKVCEIPPQRLDVKNLEACSNDKELKNLKVEVLKKPSTACSDDGVIRFTLLADNCLTTDDFSIVVMSVDLTHYGGYSSGREIIMSGLPAGPLELTYTYYTSQYSLCGAIRVPFTLEHESKETFFKLWPNPAIGQTFINYELNNCKGSVLITISDMLGKALYSETVNRTGAITSVMSISRLPAGRYTVTAFNPTSNQFYKSSFLKL